MVLILSVVIHSIIWLQSHGMSLISIDHSVTLIASTSFSKVTLVMACQMGLVQPVDQEWQAMELCLVLVVLYHLQVHALVLLV